MKAVLDFICGISWSVVYLAAIVIGIKNKTWCIPKVAICQNFAWEFWIVWGQLQSHAPWRMGYAIQFVWLILDIGILLSWLWFDRRKLGGNIILLSAVSFALYLLAHCAQQWEIMAFLINVIMSGLFLLRIRKEPGSWVSVAVAIGKVVGTLASTILYGILYANLVLLWLGGICLILDIYYLLQVKQYLKGE